MVSIDALQETIERMEGKLCSIDDTAVKDLLRTYRALIPRFESDLGSSTRDLALAKACTLMLIQEFAQNKNGK